MLLIVVGNTAKDSGNRVFGLELVLQEFSYL